MRSTVLIFVVISVSVILAAAEMKRDDATAAEAFVAVAAVLQHPRCLNCHPKGDQPLLGERSQVHAMVHRGVEGKGTPAMHCTNCHQTVNGATPHSPPGTTEEWHMPSRATPMVFDIPDKELCEQLKDPARNGGRSLRELYEHLDTPLVKWAWSPGPGRSVPSTSHSKFRAKFRQWIDNGSGCPK